MEEINRKILIGERALFQKEDLLINECIFEDGESPLKESKNIILNNAGSIAEASLKLNKVFETAQAAADQYVESVKSMAREEIREYMKRKIDG